MEDARFWLLVTALILVAVAILAVIYFKKEGENASHCYIIAQKGESATDRYHPSVHLSGLFCFKEEKNKIAQEPDKQVRRFPVAPQWQLFTHTAIDFPHPQPSTLNPLGEGKVWTHELILTLNPKP